MTLKARLTLTVLLVVLGVLGIHALALRLAWQVALYSSLDRDLEAALDLAEALVAQDPEDGVPRFVPGQSLEVLPRLLPDLVLVLAKGNELLDALGRLPPPAVLLALADGGSPGFRLRERALGELRLVAALPTREVERNLRLLDGLLIALLPLGLGLALVLSRRLLDRGLKPLSRLAGQALRLAETRDWRASLPEPPSRDEVGQVVRAVNQLLSALGEVIQSERRFHEEASHALRTPLAVLLGRMERAIDRADPPVRRELMAAREELGRLAALVERLFQLARAESGGLDLGPVVLDEVAFEEAEAFRGLFKRLDLSLPEEPVVVRADEDLLRAALRVLLENAVVHGGGVAFLRVHLREGEGVLEVGDRGPGLRGQDPEGLFRRFARGKGSRGSGLGLALVDAVARWHGGRRWARSRPGGGVVFGLALPLWVEENDSRYYLTKSNRNT
ncbi:signal transduction histidine kinase (plasmid) [Thermus oshimai JL-2]|uniref:Signal transduction histidine-protein kinase/phosphatase MprB n=1 Tax=Thermus oshimai JL-2 TaxID=751945 RepID=K7QWV7_THEOS|nr:HAMP domain-containing sensor histidine kinase [Thermus oshimai]AFV77351.1 signal transduction histidine kinase [Thermus oshimai JL-2]